MRSTISLNSSWHKSATEIEACEHALARDRDEEDEPDELAFDMQCTEIRECMSGKKKGNLALTPGLDVVGASRRQWPSVFDIRDGR